MRSSHFAAVLAAALVPALAAAGSSRSVAATPAEVRLAPADRTGLVVTIYVNGLALVGDTRTAPLAAEPRAFVFDGVADRMLPSSALLTADAAMRVLAMDYDANVLSAEALLERAVGTTVGVVRTHPTTGEETVEEAEVLSVENGVVLRYRDRIETGVPGRIVYSAVPEDLRPQPALIARIAAAEAGSRPLTLTYLTEGLSWNADYAVVLDDAAKTLRLDGRATIVNDSGIDYPDATVALVAGEVNRRTAAEPRMMARMAADTEGAAMAAPPPTPEREAFGDLHLYRLPGTVTLADGRQRQIALTGAAAVPFERRYVSESGVGVYGPAVGETRPDHPAVEVHFVNDPAAGGGEPWPAGPVRFYAADAGGTLRLLGEDMMPRTPRGERVELSPGRAFDITVRRTQTDFNRAGLGKGVFESAWQVEVRNGKDETVAVDVVERLPADWQILEESLPHRKASAGEAVWTVEVAAGEVARFTYRVRVTNR